MYTGKYFPREFVNECSLPLFANSERISPYGAVHRDPQRQQRIWGQGARPGGTSTSPARARDSPGRSLVASPWVSVEDTPVSRTYYLVKEISL
jgi:hypothetical protein